MEIITGKIEKAQKVIIYGPEGIGKSTFAAQFPESMFIDTEGSTTHMDVKRFARPTSWTMLLDQVKYVKANPTICKTLAIDTGDWAELLCIEHVCSKAQKKSIEDFGYGKGYTFLYEEFGRLLNALQEVIDIGIHVVITAHAKIRKFEQPDEMGAYDRWEMKLSKNVAPLLKEWGDMVLFANYKTIVVNVDGQGAEKGKNKAQGGKRVMYTTHTPSWDAKNRHNLKEELKLEFSEIAAHITTTSLPSKTPPTPHQQKEAREELFAKVEEIVYAVPPETLAPETTPAPAQDLPKALVDLMKQNNVTAQEIQLAVASKGYYPQDTPIMNYDPQFISGVLIAAWPKVFEMIEGFHDLPF